MSVAFAGRGNDGIHCRKWQDEMLEVEMKQNDGGPAFPCDESHGDNYEGMTLRDYFAAKASEADIAEQMKFIGPVDVVESENGFKVVRKGLPLNKRQIARFMHADAMLSAREK
jgi:hypothetical protein